MIYGGAPTIVYIYTERKDLVRTVNTFLCVVMHDYFIVSYLPTYIYIIFFHQSVVPFFSSKNE